MNLTDGATVLATLIKRAKTRVNKTIMCGTKRRIQGVATNNGWNTQIVQILRAICDGNFLFKVNFLSRLSKHSGLTHEWINTNLKYQEPEFYSRLFDES